MSRPSPSHQSEALPGAIRPTPAHDKANPWPHYICGLAILCLCAWIVVAQLDLRPGIGDPEVVKTKIDYGMTKEEIISILGRPHDQMGSDAWTYRCDFFGGTLFRVYFSKRGRVSSMEWWLN
jgi:hypothetical protein